MNIFKTQENHAGSIWFSSYLQGVNSLIPPNPTLPKPQFDMDILKRELPFSIMEAEQNQLPDLDILSMSDKNSTNIAVYSYTITLDDKVQVHKMTSVSSDIDMSLMYMAISGTDINGVSISVADLSDMSMTTIDRIGYTLGTLAAPSPVGGIVGIVAVNTLTGRTVNAATITGTITSAIQAKVTEIATTATVRALGITNITAVISLNLVITSVLGEIGEMILGTDIAFGPGGEFAGVYKGKAVYEERYGITQIVEAVKGYFGMDMFNTVNLLDKDGMHIGTEVTTITNGIKTVTRIMDDTPNKSVETITNEDASITLYKEFGVTTYQEGVTKEGVKHSMGYGYTTRSNVFGGVDVTDMSTGQSWSTDAVGNNMLGDLSVQTSTIEQNFVESVMSGLGQLGVVISDAWDDMVNDMTSSTITENHLNTLDSMGHQFSDHADHLRENMGEGNNSNDKDKDKDKDKDTSVGGGLGIEDDSD
jgi:hypothetical protein